MRVPTEFDASAPVDVPSAGVLGGLQSLLSSLNTVLIIVSAIAAFAAGLVLTWEVAGRYFFKIASDWQDEMSIFLLVGATFLSAAWIQARRGHVGIDALAHILPPAADRVRRVIADIVSLAFCTFFCWRCIALLMEAVEDGQISGSAWGPPLWIPYGLMSVGMSVLVAQLVLQLLAQFSPAQR